MKPPEWIIPLEPGNEAGPALLVEIETDLTMPGSAYRVHVWASGRRHGGLSGGLPALLPIVACQLGQALLEASAWCGAEGARREARKKGRAK